MNIQDDGCQTHLLFVDIQWLVIMLKIRFYETFALFKKV
jgi:hypothetical protein